jgi:hypothetical protein
VAWLHGSLKVFFIREDGINTCPHLVKPLPPLSFCAGNDNAEGSAVENGNAA